ncbi:hypothetical protein BT63DRAFT_457649 [Microthyrium microscopicum]|uniref:DUF4211 domain-containing protein n=1 Tax=Microthyrium microscopicum TaxID=703497 RepID=A0A6A6U5Y3_9PEZI|nr:hypothetical protein BT63DRAFT_457649 [Microthyrium microscopicum]
MVSTRKSSKKLKQTKLDFSNNSSSPSAPKKAPKRSAAKQSTLKSFLPSRGKKQSHIVVSSDSDTIQGIDTSDDEVSVKKPPIVPSRNGKRTTFQVDESSDSDDSVPVAPPSVKRARHQKQATPRRELIVESEESEDFPPVKSSGRLRRRQVTPEAESVDEDDDEEEDSDVGTPQPRKRKLDDREEEDLAEDMDFLRSSPPAIMSSVKKKSRQSEQQEALADLKRIRDSRNTQRPKKKQTVILDSDEEEEIMVTSSRAVKANTPDFIVDDDDEIEEEEDDEDDEPTARDLFQENEEDEDFIADDEDLEDGDLIGVPTNDETPIMFTKWATAKPKELFQFAVEYLVQKKINPGFNKDKEIYILTWKKLDDEVTGLAGSKFSSSVWNRDFTFALQARPQMDTLIAGQNVFRDCQACNRSNHTATYEVRFHGRPYDPHTLEDVEQEYDDDDSDEETDGRETRDRHGNVLAEEDRTYALGNHCYGNASVGHTLKHWRYSLMEWVFDHLKETGVLAPEKIVERDSWKTSKREKLVYSIIAQWTEKGTIHNLYKSYKAQVDTARESKDKYSRGNWN